MPTETEYSYACNEPGCDYETDTKARLNFHMKSHNKSPVAPVQRLQDKPAAQTATKFKVSNEPPKTPKSEPIAQVAVATQSAGEKLLKERSTTWGKWVYNDVNPLLFTIAQNYCGIPDEWTDNVIAQAELPNGKTVKFWEPTLRQRLTFSEKESERLANAFARFSLSPMGIAIQAWVESNQSLIAIGMAAFIAAKYGWKLMQTKQEIAQFKEMQQQQMSAAMEKMMNGGGHSDRPEAASPAA